MVSGFVLMAACSHKAKVIPEDKFSSIYADMFLADQWLETNYGERKAVDTLFFYDPIFEKYGYNREDYYASVNHYLKDPSKYIKILKKTQKYLDSRVPDIQKELEIWNERNQNRPPEAGVVRFAEVIKQLQFVDTISIERNDKGIYTIAPIVFDTIFKGPAVIFTDKVEELQDSTQVDSLEVEPVLDEIEDNDIMKMDLDEPASSNVPVDERRVVPEARRNNPTRQRSAPPKPANHNLKAGDVNIEKLK